MSENIVSAEASKQSAALAALQEESAFVTLRNKYPELCKKFTDSIQFQINRIERTERLAWVEKRVMEVLTGEGA